MTLWPPPFVNRYGRQTRRTPVNPESPRVFYIHGDENTGKVSSQRYFRKSSGSSVAFKQQMAGEFNSPPTSGTPLVSHMQCQCKRHLTTETKVEFNLLGSTISPSEPISVKKNHSYLPSFFTNSPRISRLSRKGHKSVDPDSISTRLKLTSMLRSRSTPKLNAGLLLDQPSEISSPSSRPASPSFSKALLRKLSIKKLRARRISTKPSSPVAPLTTEIISPKPISSNSLRLGAGLHSIQEHTQGSIDIPCTTSFEDQAVQTRDIPSALDNDAVVKESEAPEILFSTSFLEYYTGDQRSPHKRLDSNYLLPESLTSSPTRNTFNSDKIVPAPQYSFQDTSAAETVTYNPQSHELGHLITNNSSLADMADINYENHSTPFDEAAAFSTPPSNNLQTFSLPEEHVQQANGAVDDLSFDDVSHSTSVIDSIVPATMFADKSSVYNELPTLKEVNIEIFRNPLSHRLRVVSPWSQKVANSSPDSVDTLNTVEPENLAGNNSDMNQDIAGEELVLTKDEVYRREMLALIERHTSMVNKQQAEITKLRNLLHRERLVNAALSSPLQRAETPQALVERKENKTKIRNQFIPLNITITDDPKKKTTAETRFSRGGLLPPFSVMMAETHFEKKPEEFTLKPFFLREKTLSPRAINTVKSASLETTDIKPKPSFVDHTESCQSRKLEIKSQRESVASSLYFTADEEIEESEYEIEVANAAHNLTHNRRDCSESTASSLMSQVKINDSVNTSVASLESMQIIKNY